MKATLTVALAAASLFGASGCIVEHERIPDRAEIPAPPPPPADDSDAAPAPRAEVEAPAPGAAVDEEVFYTRLSPYGHWRWTPEYGRVWVPTVAYGWRPYTYGHWVLTDWGWTFASDDPWGWAAYHYGSWAYGPSFGWYWVPGRVWAPAWVSWRWGGGYACWAPIGPAGYVYAYSSPAWVVVPQQHFTQPIVSYAVAPHAAAPIVAQSAPLPGPHAAPARGGQFGPPVPQVQSAVGHPIAAVPAQAALRPVAAVGRGGAIAQPGFGREAHPAPMRGDARPIAVTPSAGPLRSPAPQAPPSSRARYGVSNTGRPEGAEPRPGGDGPRAWGGIPDAPRAGGDGAGGPPRAGRDGAGAPPRAGGYGAGAPPRAGGPSAGGPPRAGGDGAGGPPRAGGYGAGGPPRAAGGAAVAPRGNGGVGHAPAPGGGGPRVAAPPPPPPPRPAGGRGGDRGDDRHK